MAILGFIIKVERISSRPSRLLMAGVNLRSIQKLVGHKSLDVTMRYSHLSPEHLVSAVQKLHRATGTTGHTEQKRSS